MSPCPLLWLPGCRSCTMQTAAPLIHLFFFQTPLDFWFLTSCRAFVLHLSHHRKRRESFFSLFSEPFACSR